MPGFAPVASIPVASALATITATLTQTQADQTLSATAGVRVTGALTQTQADETLLSAATALIRGSLIQVQDDETLVASGTSPQPAPSADTPTGSGDDIRRRKWLEWAATRKKRRRGEPLVARAPEEVPPAEVEAPPIPEPPLLVLRPTRESRLLEANLAAVRAAQNDRLVTTIADLSDAVRRAREQDEEEALMLLLLG